MLSKIADWLYGIITRPVATLNEIAREKPVGWGLLIYTGVTLLSWIAVIFDPATYETYQEMMYLLPIAIPLYAILIAILFFSFFFLFIFSLALHLIARLLGGKGGYWNLFSAYTFASFPLIITAPITVISGFLGNFGSFLSGLTSFGISIWVLILQVIAVRESHGFSTGMSVLSYIITIVILVILPIALIIWRMIAYLLM
jgi:hypothetical protein